MKLNGAVYNMEWMKDLFTPSGEVKMSVVDGTDTTATGTPYRRDKIAVTHKPTKAKTKHPFDETFTVDSTRPRPGRPDQLRSDLMNIAAGN